MTVLLLLLVSVSVVVVIGVVVFDSVVSSSGTSNLTFECPDSVDCHGFLGVLIYDIVIADISIFSFYSGRDGHCGVGVGDTTATTTILYRQTTEMSTTIAANDVGVIVHSCGSAVLLPVI